MNEGRIEQVGHPRELYDEPANQFVMSFLGPVTRLGGTLVRPHDLELFVEPERDTVRADVVRVVRLGFEVRVDIQADGDAAWVQVTRGEAEKLGVVPGQTVFVRPGHRHLPDQAVAVG